MVGTGQASPISFNSQPKAYWFHCHLRRSVRLRLTVKRNTVQYFHKSRLVLVLGLRSPRTVGHQRKRLAHRQVICHVSRMDTRTLSIFHVLNYPEFLDSCLGREFLIVVKRY